GLGIRTNNPIEGVPFIYWLLVGISMWFFVNQGILEGTKSIASKYNHVAKMNFPLSIIPSYIVMSRFYGHIALLVAVILLCMLGVLVKDTQPAIQALMRMVFFASSILIVPPEGIVKDVMQLNPIYYLAEAYRASVLYNEWYFVTHWELTFYNFFIIVFLFVIVSILHMR